MKLLLYLFSISLLVFTSCSKDDDKPDAASFVLVNKKVYTQADTSNEVKTSQFIYNGNKIVSIVDNDGSKTSFTYTGDLITKTERKDENDVFLSSSEYIYENGKLSTFIEKRPFYSNYNKTLYTYTADGVVFCETFYINSKTGVVSDKSEIYKYTFSAGNLIKRERYGRVVSYEYDTKSNPLKNITGIGLLLDKEFEVSINNVVKIVEFYQSPLIFTCTYVYDENNFPTEQKTFTNGSLTAVDKYSY